MRKILIIMVVLVSLFPLMLSVTSCNGENQETTTQPTTSISITPDVSLYHQYSIEVELPPGWRRVDGPKYIMHHQEMQVAFNSWGQDDFQTQAIQDKNPDGSIKSIHYNPGIAASQIPDGGAYVSLERITFDPPILGQNTPTNSSNEYNLDDLSGLYQPHDWRKDSATYAFYKEFFKGGSRYSLVIVCTQNATDETADNLNKLLRSWKFIE